MTTDRELLAKAARAMTSVFSKLCVHGSPSEHWVSRRDGNDTRLFTGSLAGCDAFIAECAFAAGLRVLMESRPTPAMDSAGALVTTDAVVSVWRAMLGALLREVDYVNVA